MPYKAFVCPNSSVVHHRLLRHFVNGMERVAIGLSRSADKIVARALLCIFGERQPHACLHDATPSVGNREAPKVTDRKWSRHWGP